MTHVLVIHGPNLNLLGTREPAVYGSLTLAAIDERIVAFARDLDAEVRVIQSNHEGAIIDAIHDARHWADGIVINPGALSHYSYAIRDAIAGVALPVVEVHLSNIHARDGWRHHSVVSDAVTGVVTGLGWRGYVTALTALVGIIDERRASH
jgi:3-dehydroquinate dehydratase-2